MNDDNQPCEVPLVEQLRSVPKHENAWIIEDLSSSAHRNIPYGALCHRAADQIKLLTELLKVAKCPCCDGSGAIQKVVGSRQLVTHDMALDAGDPSLEGSVFSEAEVEVEQCQWCAERNAILGIT